MHYKIISGGQIIDACESLNYVRWQDKNRLFIGCTSEWADGLISSDGSEIYILDGARPLDLPADAAYQTVTYEEITPEEYQEIRDELDAGQAIVIPDAEEPSGEDSPKPQTRLAQLEDQVAELADQNAMLIECILEMSEVVYGE